MRGFCKANILKMLAMPPLPFIIRRPMEKMDALLFDFDGVVADTESQYTRFWNGVAERYGAAGGADFALRIKGTPLKRIFAERFAHLNAGCLAEISESLSEFEKRLSFEPVKGAVEFISAARSRGFKTALVTSSGAEKMRRAFASTGYGKLFDALVTAEDIERGKPDPMCYLAAAKLGSEPRRCAAFEDSVAGLKAGRAAGMFAVGLLTTFPESEILPLCDAAIPDFSNAEMIFSLLE